MPTVSLYTQLSNSNGGLKAAMPRVTIMGEVVSKEAFLMQGCCCFLLNTSVGAPQKAYHIPKTAAFKKVTLISMACHLTA
jgi:hypothetical protein